LWAAGFFVVWSPAMNFGKLWHESFLAPLYVLLWRGDQEVPVRAVIGIDDRAHFHLDLAGVFALTNLLVERLRKTE